MAKLTEIEEFTEEVYQLEVTDFVEGGIDGVDNKPHKALANRTKWLKSKIDAFLNGAVKVKNAILADTATKLATPIKINGVNFDGSGDITIKDDGKGNILRKNITFNDNFKNILTAWGAIGNSYRLILHSTRCNNVFCGIFDITATHNFSVDMVMSSHSRYSNIEFRAYTDNWGNHTLQVRAIGGQEGETVECVMVVVPYYVNNISLDTFSEFDVLAFTKTFR